MRDIDSSLGHHLGEVAVAQLIGDIPSDAENDDGAIKVATAKQGRCVRRRLIHATDYQPTSAFAPEPDLRTPTGRLSANPTSSSTAAWCNDVRAAAGPLNVIKT